MVDKPYKGNITGNRLGMYYKRQSECVYKQIDSALLLCTEKIFVVQNMCKRQNWENYITFLSKLHQHTTFSSQIFCIKNA